ncbi:hypothetical protein L083_2240 [Actinoplanes sp. N902-109]|nr:hypothetical protein L083_2240 [Actinoplanes sp. N902-109]
MCTSRSRRRMPTLKTYTTMLRGFRQSRITRQRLPATGVWAQVTRPAVRTCRSFCAMRTDGHLAG